MKGTEKQVKWAEDIKATYVAVAEQLREAVAILGDITQEVEIRVDPLFGKETKVMRYTASLTNTHEAAIRSAHNWWPIDPATDPRGKELEAQGVPHAYRIAKKEHTEATLKALEGALETEDSAKYWIDRR
jgi:hypothetical protein